MTETHSVTQTDHKHISSSLSPTRVEITDMSPVPAGSVTTGSHSAGLTVKQVMLESSASQCTTTPTDYIVQMWKNT